MKCPKCGSEIKENKDRDVVWDRGRTAFCNKCHIEYRIDDETNDIIYTQPTTAEMLLWLAENESIDIWHTATEGIIYVWRNGNAVKFEGKTLTEAIIKAYKWAKQEAKLEGNRK